MTKRSCPFSGDISRQFKKHVGELTGDHKKKEVVFDKTLEMLKKGSKMAFTNGKVIPKEDFVDTFKVAAQVHTQQPSIAKYFKNGRAISHAKTAVLKNEEIIGKCSFCDKTDKDVAPCVKCLDDFCPNCSFKSYDTQEDLVTCFSCIKH